MGFLKDQIQGQIQGQIDDLKKESWLFRFVVDSLTSNSDREKDYTDIRSVSWTRRFNSYTDAIFYLNKLKSKYENSSDRVMKEMIAHAFIYAKEYWKK